MNTNSNSYTIIYASVLVIIVAFLLAFVNSSLRDLQGKNVELDTKKQILSSLGIREVEDPEAKFAEVVKEDMLVAEDGSLKPYEGSFVTGYEKAYKEKGEAHLFVCEIDGQKKYGICSLERRQEYGLWHLFLSCIRNSGLGCGNRYRAFPE